VGFSGWFLYSGSQFLIQQSAAAARHLLIVSIAYLPALLVQLVFFST
jgi:heme O synthase-like polyprenyltransferase